MKIHWQIVLMILSAALTAAAFPHPNITILAWVGLVPALLAVEKTGFWKGFLLGEIFGIVFMAIVVNWFAIFGIPAIIAGSLFFGLFFALFYGLYGHLTRVFPSLSSWQRYLLPPMIWTAVEWLKSCGVLGFTWGSLGYTQYNFSSLLQTAAVAGVYGITFILVYVNNLIAHFIKAVLDFSSETGMKPWRAFPRPSFWEGMKTIFKELTGSEGSLPALRYSTLAFLLIFPSLLVLGGITIPMETKIGDYKSLDYMGDSIPIGVVQVNMPQDIKWDRQNLMPTLKILKEKTKKLADKGAKMVVWPETAIPHRHPLRDPYIKSFLSRNAQENNIYLVTGIIDRDEQGVYNSVVLIDPEGQVMERYNKMHLVPLGEYFPFPEDWRKYDNIFDDRIGNYTHGRDMKIFETPMGNFSVLICFESMFSYLALQGTQKGAQFILIITNDAWFMRSNTAKTHFIMGVFRAVENRTWIVQAANSGVSGIIDPWGNVIKETDIFTRLAIDGVIHPSNVKTIYSKTGDLLPILAGILSMIILFLPSIVKKKINQKKVENEKKEYEGK